MGLTISQIGPISGIDAQNQTAAHRVASALSAVSGAGVRTSPAAAPARAVPAAATSAPSSSSTSAAASNAGQITSNDFLTLLVTELQNQDPTQPTDPNAYINQLVGVNSLQQLISINQDLTPSSSTTSSAKVAAKANGTSGS
jgi:flagellar basal-body rod modification protein FlgD